jgi:cation:H+ antiporter
MLVPVAALIGGIVLLVLSADKFVEGASATATRAGLPPLLIGIVIIGFGSSMPEVVVSALASLKGNPALALGNALGSNITNIALILGVTALISPIAVHSSVLQRELPLLTAITTIAALLVFFDQSLSREDGILLIVMFLAVMGWSIHEGLTTPSDALGTNVQDDMALRTLSRARAASYLILGLLMLIVSSQILVWGGIEIAKALGISDLLIGLTVVAVGTSLPELASSIAAVRRNEHDLAIGNVIGSNMFNTSIVIGISGVIQPASLDPAILNRDFPVLIILTLALFVFGYWFRGQGTGRITRLEGALLLLCYVGYNIVLALSAVSAAGAVAR